MFCDELCHKLKTNSFLSTDAYSEVANIILYVLLFRMSNFNHLYGQKVFDEAGFSEKLNDFLMTVAEYDKKYRKTLLGNVLFEMSLVYDVKVWFQFLAGSRNILVLAIKNMDGNYDLQGNERCIDYLVIKTALLEYYRIYFSEGASAALDSELYSLFLSAIPCMSKSINAYTYNNINNILRGDLVVQNVREALECLFKFSDCFVKLIVDYISSPELQNIRAKYQEEKVAFSQKILGLQSAKDAQPLVTIYKTYQKYNNDKIFSSKNIGQLKNFINILYSALCRIDAAVGREVSVENFQLFEDFNGQFSRIQQANTPLRKSMIFMGELLQLSLDFREPKQQLAKEFKACRRTAIGLRVETERLTQKTRADYNHILKFKNDLNEQMQFLKKQLKQIQHLLNKKNEGKGEAIQFLKEEIKKCGGALDEVKEVLAVVEHTVASDLKKFDETLSKDLHTVKHVTDNETIGMCKHSLGARQNALVEYRADVEELNVTYGWLEYFSQEQLATMRSKFDFTKKGQAQIRRTVTDIMNAAKAQKILEEIASFHNEAKLSENFQQDIKSNPLDTVRAIFEEIDAFNDQLKKLRHVVTAMDIEDASEKLGGAPANFEKPVDSSGWVNLKKYCLAAQDALKNTEQEVKKAHQSLVNFKKQLEDFVSSRKTDNVNVNINAPLKKTAECIRLNRRLARELNNEIQNFSKKQQQCVAFADKLKRDLVARQQCVDQYLKKHKEKMDVIAQCDKLIKTALAQDERAVARTNDAAPDTQAQEEKSAEKPAIEEEDSVGVLLRGLNSIMGRLAA